MREADFERLKSVPLFANISSETAAAIAACAFLQRFPARTLLLMEGDPVDFLYVLINGLVELNGVWKDRETTLAVLGPISTFSLAAAVLDAPALMSAQTIERSELLMLPSEALRRAMRADADFACTIAQELAGCYRGVVRVVKSQKLRGGAERLASYLISQRIRQGGAQRFQLAHEKRVLASLLGMTPETLSRAFQTLARYGVEVHGPEVEITRPGALERLARPTPLIDNHMPAQPGSVTKAERERWSPPAGATGRVEAS